MDSAATREYQALSGCAGPIPVEMGFSSGGGSNCGHWQESCLLTEIMTPAASGSLPISRLTVAALEDLGFEVDYSAAQAFPATQLSSSCRCNNRVRRQLHDVDLEDEEETMNGPRRLSEEGWQSALQYGRTIIAENQKNMNLFPGEIPDLGTERIYVLYEENGVVHNIMVTSKD
jgi:Leishmanolysin